MPGGGVEGISRKNKIITTKKNNMKKIILAAVAFAACAVAVAQSPTTTFVNQIPSYIPQIYTTNNAPTLAVVQFDDGTDALQIRVYDSNLQPTGNPIPVPSAGTIVRGNRYEWLNPSTLQWELRPDRSGYEDNYTATPMVTISGLIGGNGINDLTGFMCSQKLFNNDAQYEFILPILGSMNDTDMYYSEVYNYDTYEYVQAAVRDIRLRTKCVGFKVVKADGTVQNTVYFPANHYLDADMGDGMFLSIVARIGSNHFLAFPVEERTYIGDGDYDSDMKILVYNVSSGTLSVTAMDVSLPFNVFPSLVRRGEDVTIDLGNSDAKEIRVINSLGQTVKTVPIRNGESKVKVNTGNLDEGMNIINARGEKAEGNSKIIVR